MQSLSLSKQTKILEAVLGCIITVALFMWAISTWANENPTPYCSGDICAGTADTLRVLQEIQYGNR